MATAAKLLLATLLLFFFLKVNGQRCDLSSVEVGVTNTGKRSGYDTVFEVEVKNTCRCTLTDVSLYSEGFASVVNVDPKLFRREGAGYLVNDGKGIPSSSSVKFQYAWDRAFKMTASDFQVACGCRELMRIYGGLERKCLAFDSVHGL